MEQGIKNKDERFFLDCYNSNTAVFIINKDADWITGYVNDIPNNLFCEILDRKRNRVIRVIYSNIHIKKEFSGDYLSLPLTKKLREHGERE
jgi:hypothetical protein